MQFIIYALDRSNALHIRMKYLEKHKAFLTQAKDYGVSIAMAGPLIADDSETMIGSFFLLDAENREAVEAFNAADPFTISGLWQDARIDGFTRRW